MRFTPAIATIAATAAIQPRSLSKQRGATMIEVLVSILVLALGTFGIAGLQTVAVRTTASTANKAQATILALNITETIRANPFHVKAYALNPGDTAPAFIISGSPAAASVAAWRASIDNQLPNGKSCITYANGLLTVIVAWNDSRGDNTDTLAACVEPTTNGGVRSVTLRTVLGSTDQRLQERT